MLGSHAAAEVAAELGITDRHLRRLLLGDVGLGPKTYQRILRLQRFLAASEEGQPDAAAAAAAGYADQAHLRSDTRALAAHTPARLLEIRGLAR